MKNKLLFLLVFCLAHARAHGQFIISTVAGTGSAGNTGNGGQAIAAKVQGPQSVAFDPAGNMYITSGNYVRKISTTGIISIVAGGGSSTADAVPGTSALLNDPYKVAVDAAGNVYFTEFNTHKVRMVNAATGLIYTIAGSGTYGFSGDGGPAVNANFKFPTGIAVNPAGTQVFVADYYSTHVRVINWASGTSAATDPTTGTINTYVGGGSSSTDGSLGESYALGSCDGLSLTSDGRLYICEGSLNRIVVAAPTPSPLPYPGDVASGPVTLVGGFACPYGCQEDAAGNLFVAAYCGNKIMKRAPDGTITTVVGIGWITYYGDGCEPLSSAIQSPYDVTLRGPDMYIADCANHRIRKVAKDNIHSFINGPTQTITACPNITGTLNSTPINNELAITEIDFGSANRWTVLTPPAHGTIVGIPGGGVTFASTGVVGGAYNTTTTPTGISYRAATGYTGSSDAFTIQVTDCIGQSVTTTINVSLYTPPTIFDISGPSYYCSGTPFTITLSGSEPGVNYQIYKAGTAGAAQMGTGGSLAFTGLTVSAGTVNFTIKATNTTTGCSEWMNTTLPVTYSALPLNQTMTPSTPRYCAGGGGIIFGLASSQSLVSYEFFRDATSLGALSGTGGVLTLTSAQTLAATYSVVATNAAGCHTNITPVRVLTVDPMPVPGSISVSAGGHYCTGSTGVTITLTGAEPGYTYWLYNTATTLAASWTNTTYTTHAWNNVTAGTYVIRAQSNHGCGPIDVTTEVTVVADPSPDVFAVTGGGTICSGGSVDIGLSGSNTDVTYQLKRGTTLISSTIYPLPPGPVNFSPAVGTAGTYTVLATLPSSGCTRAMSGSAVVVVNPLPTLYTVTGGGAYCYGGLGLTIGLSNSQAFYTYSLNFTPAGSGTTSFVTSITRTGTGAFDFGLQTEAGVYTIVASSPAGCIRTMGSRTITINPLPLVYDVTSTGSLCTGSASFTVKLNGSQIGYRYQLYNGATASGTAWTNTSSGTSGTSTTTTHTWGPFTSGGAYSVVATLPSGTSPTCPVAMTGTVSLTPLPVAGTITGTGTVCLGGTSTLATTGDAGGAWSASNSNASVTGGVVSGLATGTCTISYTASNSCGSSTATTVVTINDVPAVASITGASLVCVGSTLSLANATAGGTWSSSNEAVATIDASGIVTPASIGTCTISYAVTNACGTTVVTAGVTADNTPVVSAISGPSAVCMGSSISLSATVTSGTTSYTDAWTSGSAGNATVNSSGEVTPVATGSATISYAVTNGCGTTTVTQDVAINDVPVVDAIAGGSTVCVGSTLTLTDATADGTWTSGNEAVATIDASGIVTPVATGTCIVSYAVDNSCGTAYATAVISVNDVPVVAAIGGTTSGCTGATVTLTDATAGGTWSTTSTIASVSSDGVVSFTSVGSSTITYTVTNSCGATAVTAPVTVVAIAWTGAVSTDWNNGANWACGLVPTTGDDVTIPSGTPHDPEVMTAASGYTHSLSIATGVTLTLDAGAVLSAGGDLSNNAIVTGAGEIVLAGTTAQAISGTGFISNLELANAAGATIGSSSADLVKVKGTVTLTNGLLTTNNKLTLWSDAAGTGRIGTVTSGSITGNVSCMQYVPGGRRAYRFWGHPYSTSITLDQIQDDIDLTGTGGATNGFTTTSTNSASVFWYNLFNGNSTLSNDPGWTAYTSTHGGGTGGANDFKQFEGIRMFIRGAKGEGLTGTGYTPSPVTITTSGTVNTGTLAMPLPRTNVMVGAEYSQTFSQVSNPYPSPVDLGTLLNSHGNASMLYGTYYWIWNPYISSAGQYVRKDIGTPYYIQANTSYQLRAADVSGGAYLTFMETDKVASSADVLLRDAPATISLSLNIYNEANELYDMLDVDFNDNATDKEDRKYDAGKPMAPEFNFYALSTDKQPHSLEARPYKEGSAIPLAVYSTCHQPFTIKVDNYAVPAGSAVYLYDKLLNEQTLLSQGTAYAFSMDGNATLSENRFELRMGGSPSVSTAADTKLYVTLAPNPANSEVALTYRAPATEQATVRVLDMTGKVVLTKQLDKQQEGTATLQVGNLAAGIYLVEFTAGGEKSVQRLIKE